MESIKKNSIFTNVLLTPEGGVWWEDMGVNPPERGIDWQGQDWTPDCGRKGAHPNARFTAPAKQCPAIDPDWEKPEGVLLSAMLFGGRRPSVIPLVAESFDWAHGVYMGSSAASETTAAALHKAGVLRRDPFAMLPFCGYHMGDYFAHWLSFEKRTSPDKLPKIFFVNWFRRGLNNEFLWPGYGENSRVLKWICERIEGKGKAVETPIGYLPTMDAIDTTGLELPNESLQKLLEVDIAGWKKEVDSIEEYFKNFGDRMPYKLNEQVAKLRDRLNQS